MTYSTQPKAYATLTAYGLTDAPGWLRLVVGQTVVDLDETQRRELSAYLVKGLPDSE